jgi:hypothetical protein
VYLPFKEFEKIIGMNLDLKGNTFRKVQKEPSFLGWCHITILTVESKDVVVGVREGRNKDSLSFFSIVSLSAHDCNNQTIHSFLYSFPFYMKSFASAKCAIQLQKGADLFPKILKNSGTS